MITWSKKIVRHDSLSVESEIGKELDFEKIIDKFAFMEANFLFPPAPIWLSLARDQGPKNPKAMDHKGRGIRRVAGQVIQHVVFSNYSSIICPTYKIQKTQKTQRQKNKLFIIMIPKNHCFSFGFLQFWFFLCIYNSHAHVHSSILRCVFFTF